MCSCCRHVMASACTTGLLCCCRRAKADRSEDRADVMLPVFPVKPNKKKWINININNNCGITGIKARTRLFISVYICLYLFEAQSGLSPSRNIQTLQFRAEDDD